MVRRPRRLNVADGDATCKHRPMAEIAVTVSASGEAYVTLVVGAVPAVRHSVALDALEAANAIPALDGLVLDFDYYGRVVGLRITGAADSILAPSLLEAAERGEPEDLRRS
jgi:hypothetical protein